MSQYHALRMSQETINTQELKDSVEQAVGTPFDVSSQEYEALLMEIDKDITKKKIEALRPYYYVPYQCD